MRLFLGAMLVGLAARQEICPPAAAKIYYLLGAGYEDDEDEGLGILEELGLQPALRAPQLEDEEEPLPPERPGKKSFALRLGALLTTSGSDTWMTGVAGELAFQGRRWEAGVEVSQIENAEESVRSLLIAARAGYALRASNGLHAFLSGGAVLEQGEMLTVGEKGSRWAGILTVGAGYGRLESAWELRVSYNVLLGSTNASGSVFAGAGVRF